MENNKGKTEYHLKWFDMVMQEYNSLRNESADSLKNQQSIINYGLAAIGVLIAFSASLWGKEKIVEIIYVIFIPFLCNLIILIWNGEVRRMSRAGQYIKRIEDKVLQEFSKEANISIPALEWETFLRKPKLPETPEKAKTKKAVRTHKDNKIKSNYIAIIIMFGGLSIFSIILGTVHNYGMTNIPASMQVAGLMYWLKTEYVPLILYALIFAADIFLFIYHYRYFQKVKK